MNELAPLRRAYAAIDEPEDRAVATARQRLLAEITVDDLTSLAENGRLSLERYEVGRERHRRRWGLVAVAAVILVGALVVTPAFGIGERILDLIQGGPKRPAIQSPIWSPDGRRIAFVAWNDGNWEFQVVHADGSGRRTLGRPNRDRLGAPAWSPDGRRIAFARASASHGGADLHVMNADGSQQRRLAARNVQSPVWSPDGQTIAFWRHSRVYLVDADGSALRALTHPTRAGAGASLAWSLDGRRLAFVTNAGTNGDLCFQIHVVDTDGSGERDVTGGSAPHRHGLVDCRRASSYSGLSWSPDGKRIFFVESSPMRGVSWIGVINADGSSKRRLTRALEFVTGLAVSPDGRKLVFASQLADADSGSEIVVMDADGSGRQALTGNTAHDGDPGWSPDGRKIVFVSTRDGEHALYVMNADGSEQRRLTQNGR